MLGMGMSLTTPFYILYATRRLGVAPETAGVYIWAATIGGAVSSLVWAHFNDRRGPRAAIRGGTICTLLAPTLALTTPFLARGLDALLGVETLPYLFGLVFLVAGSSMNGMWIGTNNYLFDLASHQERPRYIAILNTLAIPGVLVPWVAGEALKSVPYPAVFACLVVIGATVCGLAWRMPRPRRNAEG
jgi:MFS family permease